MRGEVWAIVPAGGSGQRFSASRNKLLENLGGVPVLVRTLQALLSSETLNGIVISAPLERHEQFMGLIAPLHSQKPIILAPGGENRQDSVYNGLLSVPVTCEVLAVHDAARPLVSSALIDRTVGCVLAGEPGAIAALPMTDTVKRSRENSSPGGTAVIGETLDRATLWRAQTPQVFRKKLLLEAFRVLPKGYAVTDEAQMLEITGLAEVSLVPGEERNLKITRPEDLALAEALLALP